MKKSLFLAVASLALAAVADAFSPSIGVRQFTSSVDNFILPVMFDSLSAVSISAKELVATNGLDVGTALYVYQDNTYTSWLLTANGWVATAKAAEGVPATAPDENQTLTAGHAIWITPVKGKTFSIYGKVASSISVMVVAGTKTSPKNYLLANPTGSAIALSTALTDMTPKKGDTIRIIGDTDTYTYNETAKKWYKISPGASPAEATLPSLAAFTGFWYMSKGGSGTIALH